MSSSNNEVHIWYLYHSGFAVKTSRHLLVFDYFMDSPDGKCACLDTGVINPEEIRDLDVIVFSSHGHSDHFNPVIFDWKKGVGAVEYVLSYDIQGYKDMKHVHAVYPGKLYTVKGVDIEVFDSTDIGVSFLVKCDGVTLFHAGDLNWWHWEGEPEEENNIMAENYKKQIDLLREKQIDIAFIPLDPRLEGQYVLGLDYFMKSAGANMVFPMHFGKDYTVFEWLKKEDRAAAYLANTVEITRRGQHFVYRRL